MNTKHAVLAALTMIAASAPVHAAVTISTAATQNMNCQDGTCVPTASNAVLNVSDLQSALSQFGNVRVMTTGSGVEANDIVVTAALSSPNSTSLTLEAHKVIAVNAAVSIGSRTAELELQSDTLNATDALSFEKKGHITLSSLSDTFGINGVIFKLVRSVQGLARAVAANRSGAFALANDYDAGQDGTYTSSPVAGQLMGTLEGLGNTISHLVINSHDSADVGLFAWVGTTGTVKGLRLRGANVHNRRSRAVGILAAENSGILFGDRVSGRARGRVVGGMVGINDSAGVIAASVSDALVIVNGRAARGGGIAGENSGTISNSYATGDITGGQEHDWADAGGVAGFNHPTGIIDLSFATGAVSIGGYSNIGGLAGENDGSIFNCYATGSVTGQTNAGGLIGRAFTATTSSSFSTGAVTGHNPGGLVGYVETVRFTHTYWDTDTSGITDLSQGAGNRPNDGGITGLSTAQFQSGLPKGFKPKIWAEDPNINNGLPYLVNNPPPN